MAVRVDSNDFLQLIEDTVQRLVGESGRVGNLQITGRLVNMPPMGEAIIVGDIHGDLESLAHILKSSSFVEKARKGENLLLVFLGDYGDRGVYSPEVYYVVLKLKEMFPQNVVWMRGNHEGPDPRNPQGKLRASFRLYAPSPRSYCPLRCAQGFPGPRGCIPR